MTNPNDDMLETAFAQARKTKASPGDDLIARVLADAASVQAGFAPVAVVGTPGLWARMMDALGGWPAVSGLAAATVAGIWVGVAPPASVADMTTAFLGDEVNVSLLSSELGFETGTFFDG